MTSTQLGVGGHARGSSTIDKQIASSNATANAFLGGRQPSWMTSGAATRKAASRPVFSLSPVAHAVQQHHQQSAVLPSPAPSDEPSPALSNALDSPNTNTVSPADANNMGSTTASTAAPLPVIDAHFVHDPSDSPDAQELPRPVTVDPAPFAEDRSPAVGSHLFQAPNSATRDSQDKHSRSRNFNGGSTPATHRGSIPPLKRRRIDQPPSIPAKLSSLLPTLEQYVQSRGGDQALDQGIEKPRMMLLRDACRSEDEFFLILHQLFSIWSINRQDTYICLPLSREIIDSAFAILGGVLKENKLISPALREWFAQFPFPLEEFSRGRIGGSAVILQIAMFLDKLVKGHEALIISSLQRKYPFLVDELLSHLNCYSPVLQFILFTACRRRLGVPDDRLGSQIEQAFREDQRKHRDAVTGLQAFAPVTYAGELEQRNASLIAYYKHVVETAAFRSSSQINPRPPDLLASPSPVSTVQQSARGNTLPSAQIPQYRQAVFNPYSQPNPFRHAYPSSVLPPPSTAPTTAANPYTIRKQNPNSPAPLSSSSQTTQQSPQAVPTPASQYRVAANSVPNSQPDISPSEYPMNQQHTLAQRRQFAVQELNGHQYQRSSPVTASFPQPANLHVMPQPPNGGIQPSRGVQPTQTLQIQPAQYNAGTQPVQPVVTPTHSTGHGIRPGPASPPQSTAPPIQHGLSQIQQTPQVKDRLLPPKGTLILRPEWPFDPSGKKSIMMSLHQANARSPRRVIKDGVTERFYQAVKSLVVGPVPIPPKNTLYEFRFEVTKEQFALAATTSNKPGILVPLVEHFDGALRWRVRTCLVPGLPQMPTEQEWVTLEVEWPENIFMTLNDRALVVRRKTHHGKDVAAELTDFVICGANVLKLSVPDVRREHARNRFVAVEVLETLRHSTVIKSVFSGGVLPEEATLNIIKARLTSSVDNDVSFEAPDLAIDLADPFSATIFKVPARGIACTHMECFDLETWLNTRPAKPSIICPHGQVKCTCSKTPEPSNPDKWRCPICFKDARPCSLRIDGFLLKVKAQLEEKGNLRSKSMRVKADGSWSVVLETNDDGEESDGEGGTAPLPGPARVKGAHAPAAVSKEIEVIEID